MKYLNIRHAAGLAAAAVVLTACKIEREAGDFPEQTIPDVIESTEDAGPRGDVSLGGGGGAGTLTGTWLLVHDRSTCVETISTQEQLTRAVYRIRIEQDGSATTETRDMCDISLSPILGQRLEIPEEVFSNVEFVDIDRGLISSLRPGGSYISSTEVGLWGLDSDGFDDPLSDRLPEDEQSDAVADQDEDDQPAVTFLLVGGGSSCERYNAQRQIIRYRGTFTTPNQIDGSSTGHTDLVVYGASRSLCGLDPVIRANDEHSRFRMYRIDGEGGAVNADADGDGSISCEEIRRLPIEQDYPKPDSDNARCDGASDG